MTLCQSKHELLKQLLLACKQRMFWLAHAACFNCIHTRVGGS